MYNATVLSKQVCSCEDSQEAEASDDGCGDLVKQYRYLVLFLLLFVVSRSFVRGFGSRRGVRARGDYLLYGVRAPFAPFLCIQNLCLD